MGFCSYCYRHAGSSYGLSDECWSWSQARGCSKITGPDDPIRLARKREYELNKAKKLRAEAKKIRKEAKERSASMDREAAKYEHGV